MTRKFAQSRPDGWVSLVRFLADMGISMSTVRALRQQGHEVVHLREEGLGRLPDAAILAKARQEQRIVLTFMGAKRNACST